MTARPAPEDSRVPFHDGGQVNTSNDHPPFTVRAVSVCDRCENKIVLDPSSEALVERIARELASDTMHAGGWTFQSQARAVLAALAAPGGAE